MSADDWRAEADRRTERHRRGDYAIAVRDAAGAPVAGARVTARLERHRFALGAAVTPLLAAEGEDAERYRRFVLAHCDSVVCENQMKWYHVERERGRRAWDEGDALAAFARRHRLAMRGHCLLWAKAKFVQPWAQALTAEDLRAAAEDHVAAVIARWRDGVTCWDGINEMLDGDFFRARLGPDADAALYRHAHALAPELPLFVNEYGILDSDGKLARYLHLIEDLRARGAVIGGIGVQEHAAERFVPDDRTADADAERPERQGRGPLVPEAVWRRLDALAALGLPIHLTEISVKTADPQRRADTLEMLLRTAMAHPAVESLLLWGFWERSHWLGRDAALVDAQWNPLPAGERLTRLRAEWTTRVDAATADDGLLRFRGFHGRYAVEVAAPGRPPVAAEVEFAPGQATATIVG